MEEKKQGKSKGKHRILLIALAAVGVLLVLLGNQGSLWGKEEGQAVASDTLEDDLIRYGALVEQKIVSLCQGVNGAGEVRAIVSFEGDFSYTYAKDGDVTEKEGAVSERSEYVTVGSGSAEQPVLLSRTPPPIGGIGIVCSGGGDASVRREITALLSAAFGIGSNKIYVACGRTNS